MGEVFRNNPQGLKRVGNQHRSLSPYLKAWIKAGDILIVGAIGQGTSRTLTSNWSSPFEDASVGQGSFQKTAALAQQVSGMTMVTDLNSEQIWGGSQPHTIPLVLELYALADAGAEVRDAIIALERVASPDLNDNLPFSTERSDGQLAGNPPGLVDINIGRSMLYQNVVIESIETPLDGPVTRDGDLAIATVQINLQTKSVINRGEIAATFG